MRRIFAKKKAIPTIFFTLLNICKLKKQFLGTEKLYKRVREIQISKEENKDRIRL